MYARHNVRKFREKVCIGKGGRGGIIKEDIKSKKALAHISCIITFCILHSEGGGPVFAGGKTVSHPQMCKVFRLREG